MILLLIRGAARLRFTGGTPILSASSSLSAGDALVFAPPLSRSQFFACATPVSSSVHAVCSMASGAPMEPLGGIVALQQAILDPANGLC